ncbi:MAG: septum formation initiator family protein [Spirosomataceae bacterium]
MKSLLKWLRSVNPYVLSAAIWVVWMLFFDPNDLFTQIGMWWKVRELRKEKAFYEEKIIEVKKEQREVLGNAKLVEKYARERYLMRKPTEDVFVLVDEDNEPIEK